MPEKNTTNVPQQKKKISSRKGLATGIMLTAGVLATNLSMGQTQTNKNTESTNKGKATTEYIKDTKQRLLGIDQYDYDKMLHIDISLLSPEVAKKVMFERINEIRKEHNMPTLQYNTVLDSIALTFAQEKHVIQRKNDPYCHYDKYGNGPYERMKKSSIGKNIQLISIGKGQYKGSGENISSTNGSIYAIMEKLMNSPMHKQNILSPYINSVGIGYDPLYDTLVQDFCNLK